MKYTKEWLIEEIKKGKEFEYFGFWGQRTESIEERAMSNFYQSNFEAPLAHGKDKGKMRTFSCSEQYLMYLKALCFNDIPKAEETLVNGKYGKFYQSIGRQVGESPNSKPYDEEYWASLRARVTYKAVYYKFKDPQLKKWLLSTGDKIIVETSPLDRYFGVGLAKTNKQGVKTDWENPLKWRGDNILGFVLMEVRDTILKNEK